MNDTDPGATSHLFILISGAADMKVANFLAQLKSVAVNNSMTYICPFGRTAGKTASKKQLFRLYMLDDFEVRDHSLRHTHASTHAPDLLNTYRFASSSTSIQRPCASVLGRSPSRSCTRTPSSSSPSRVTRTSPLYRRPEFASGKRTKRTRQLALRPGRGRASSNTRETKRSSTLSSNQPSLRGGRRPPFPCHHLVPVTSSHHSIILC